MIDLAERVSYSKYALIPCEFTSVSPDIKGIEGHPNVISKTVESLDCFFSSPMKRWHVFKETVDTWKELGSYKGINLPKYQPVVGKFNEDDRVWFLFVLAEKVKGENLAHKFFTEEEKTRFRPQFEALFDSLVQYSCDKATQGGNYFYDQKLDQYVLGTTTNDPNEKVYLVDLDNTYRYFDAQHPEAKGNQTFWEGYLHWVYEIMREMEFKLGGQQMIEPRKKLYDLVSRVDVYHPYCKFAAHLADTLYGDQLAYSRRNQRILARY